MNRLGDFFSRRIAGVPVGIIAVLVAGGVLVLALRMRGANTDTVSSDESTADDIAGDATDPENPIFKASPTTPTVVAVPTEDTNELWAQRARDYLKSHGLSPSAAQIVVDKYLNSDPLTSSERESIDNVIGAIGYPPDPPSIVDAETDPGSDTVTGGSGGGGTPAGNGGDTMPPTKQGEPPTHHTVVNARDNGPGELAYLYYGSRSADKVARLEAANWEKGPGPWPKGTKITVPADRNPQFFTATKDVRGLNEIAAKNGVNKEFIKALNPGMNFPVAKGTKVRVN